jgi:hypothetical protein
MTEMSVREYAETAGISLGAAYLRIWKRKVRATQRNGRWFVFGDGPEARPLAQEQEAAAHETSPHLGDLEPDRSYAE